jgi:hypothetical protein
LLRWYQGEGEEAREGKLRLELRFMAEAEVAPGGIAERL